MFSGHNSSFDAMKLEAVFGSQVQEYVQFRDPSVPSSESQRILRPYEQQHRSLSDTLSLSCNPQLWDRSKRSHRTASSSSRAGRKACNTARRIYLRVRNVLALLLLTTMKP